MEKEREEKNRKTDEQKEGEGKKRVRHSMTEVGSLLEVV